ncbi:AMP-binding protein [Streptomyces lavenduligriseus]|uniref:AMP-binding protein n=1 Tax=Streptomyces lavenduligriseus TaxID=67315 RepID=A0ABT0NTK3_9ACTN|nr:AMP-binding protein [Streptomyces lavenduligriseus]MCL3994628.1 AMP-binding protein [Streptomyces lavenduligriseus]
MSRERTLAEAFLDAVHDRPGHPFLTLVEPDGDRTVTLAELAGHAAGAGRLLRESGARPGDRVPLVFDSGLAAVAAFFGTLLAGMTPAMVAPPMGRRQGAAYQEHVRGVTERCASRLGLTDREFAGALDGAAAHPFLPLVPDRPEPVPDRPDAPEAAGPVALLQFTSGSTRVPKGVQVTHAGVLDNTAMFAERFGLGPGRPFCSWLPLHHDFGLIGGLLSSLLSGGSLVLMPPQAFIRSPLGWLRAAQRGGATVTGSPNFGLALFNRRFAAEPAEHLDGLDLSGLRTVVVGSDPVVPETVEAFQKLLAPYGLHERAVRVGYGLAENTLVVTAVPDGQPLRTLTVRRPDGVRGPVRPTGSTSDGPVVTAVSCGTPAGNQEVSIVDEHGTTLGPDVIGEIQVSGRSVALGYLDDPEATAAAFPGGALRTGDLGFLHDGELYVTGRLKDVVIARGRNLNALDVERVVRTLPGAHEGECAAFGARTAEGEELVVAQEVRPASPEDHRALAREVTALIVREFGIAPADVLLVRMRTLPRTSSGKLRRSGCADLYERGELVTLYRQGSAAV